MSTLFTEQRTRLETRLKTLSNRIQAYACKGTRVIPDEYCRLKRDYIKTGYLLDILHRSFSDRSFSDR